MQSPLSKMMAPSHDISQEQIDIENERRQREVQCEENERNLPEEKNHMARQTILSVTPVKVSSVIKGILKLPSTDEQKILKLSSTDKQKV